MSGLLNIVNDSVTNIICKITTARYINYLLISRNMRLRLLLITIIIDLHTRWWWQLFERTYKVTGIRRSVLLVFIVNFRLVIGIILPLQSRALRFIMSLSFTVYAISTIIRNDSIIITSTYLSSRLVGNVRNDTIYLLSVHI